METVMTELEVRWGECDPAGIVYHPVYFDWFAIARMHFLQENRISYMQEFHDKGIVLVVLDARCIFKKTLRAEDKILVEAKMDKLGKARLRMTYQVKNAQGELCAEGYTEHAYVDMHQRPLNLAKKIPELWHRLNEVPHESF